jgi:hypothetical protein
MNKIVLFLLLAAVAVFATFGFIKAQKLNRQSKELLTIISEVPPLQKISNNEFDAPISTWQTYVSDSQNISDKLKQIDYIPANLRDKLDNFYSKESTEQKLKEIRYYQLLTDGQRRIGVKDNPEKGSKGQIESVLKDLDKTIGNLEKEFISISSDDSEYNSYFSKIQSESAIFTKQQNDKWKTMTYESPSVEINGVALNKSFNEFRVALVNSLNKQVDLQKEIQDDIKGIGGKIWVSPF